MTYKHTFPNEAKYCCENPGLPSKFNKGGYD